MKSTIPAPELLRKLLRYEPETGKLYWRERDARMFKNNNASSAKSWNTMYGGKEAGTICGKGYRSVAIFAKIYIGHRLIWAIQTGRWPSDQIDHIDGEKLNNRLNNLREVSSHINSINARMNSANTSGHAGVYLNKRSSMWCAQIKFKGRTYHLGSSKNINDVIALRQAEEKRLGFTERHGK